MVPKKKQRVQKGMMQNETKVDTQQNHSKQYNHIQSDPVILSTIRVE